MALTPRAKNHIIAASIILPMVAAGVYFGISDYGYGQQAETLRISNEANSAAVEDFKKRTAADEKWGAVSYRIALPELDGNEVTDISFIDNFVFPASVLPGFKKLETEVRASADYEIRESKEKNVSMAYARLQAQTFCKLTDDATPAEVDKDLSLVPPVLTEGPEVVKNIPLYGEYCGIDSAPYKGAIIKAQEMGQ